MFNAFWPDRRSVSRAWGDHRYHRPYHLLRGLRGGDRAITVAQIWTIRLEEAARDLGAGPVRVFFDVTLPVIAPALVAGWLLAFTLVAG
jgi:hypothetical protein